MTTQGRTLRRQHRPEPSAGRNAKDATATDVSASEAADASNALAMLRENAVHTEAAAPRRRLRGQGECEGSTRPTE